MGEGANPFEIWTRVYEEESRACVNNTCSHILSHLILSTIVCVGHYYYSYFSKQTLKDLGPNHLGGDPRRYYEGVEE